MLGVLFLVTPIVLAGIAVMLMVHVMRTSAKDQAVSEAAVDARTSAERINSLLVGPAGPDRAAVHREVAGLEAALEDLRQAPARHRPFPEGSDPVTEYDIAGVRRNWSRVRPELDAWMQSRQPAPATLVSAGLVFADATNRLEERTEVLGRANEREHLALISALLLLQILGLMAAAITRAVDLRRLKRHEQEIANLSLVTERTGSSIVLCGADGRATWANDAFLRSTGWLAHEIPGQPAIELLCAHDGRGPGDAELRDAIARGARHVREIELHRRDGTAYWASLELVPLNAEDPAAPRFALTFTDVTARVSVTKALQTSEARFRSALAALNEGFLIFDADGSIIECNDEFVRITGYPREMMVGATAGEVSRRIARLGIAHPVQADGTPLRQHEDPVAVTMLTGRACSEAVYGIHRPSGERRWISTNTAPFELPGSDRPGVVATMADITERRRAEDKVRLLTSVVADSPTIVLITDAADRIEYVNDAFSVRTGWTLEEVCGRTPEFMLSDLTLPETWAELMSALGSGGAWRGEVHNTTRSGETWLASSQVYVLRGADGRVTHHVALLQDITGQRHREDELTRVREAALSAARAKNEFLQNMSHELRTPLNGILGMSELLLQTSLDVEQRADLVQLRRSGEDLLTVINHLFDFARIESGGAARESVPFRLGGCIREVQAALASAAEARGLTWAVHVDDELPDTRVGDVGALRRVLLCLVSNAVKFTEQGEVTLSVRTHDATGSGANVWFEMRDTGIGIAAERQAQIFEAFEQVDGSTTRKYGGVGLGLALATRLVRHMGGVLEVESVPGRGSSFSFAVPLEVAAEGLEGPGVAAAVSPIVPALAGSRVLLVVARMPARAATLAALERAGATVDVTRVADGPEAAARLLAEAHASPYRAIVLDERDGGHHAFDFALRLRRALGGVLPAALLFTSAGERGDAARCRELGITGYLASPAGDDDLVEALRHVRPATTAPAPLVTRHLLREGFAKRRVLLVEDNPVNRKVASRMLDRSGYDVTVAVEGAEAIDRFREASWDIVLMDVQMPGMDGLEATRRIRELERAGGLHRTPILAVTAHTLDSDRSAVLEAGMDDLVPKPIQADHLFATMQRYLADAPAAPFAATAPLALEDVIDWQDALERMDGDAAIMEQILRIFLEDCPNIMQRLEEARASGDAVQLERAAHGLKGASGTISARHVEPLAREVERLARTGRLSEAHDRFEDLRREMLRLMKVLENLPPPQQQQDAA